jgi:hypothetical protein
MEVYMQESSYKIPETEPKPRKSIKIDSKKLKPLEEIRVIEREISRLRRAYLKETEEN